MSDSESVPTMPKSRPTHLPWCGGVDGDEDVARMHVGVEEAVAEHLREEELDAGARETLQVDALGAAAGRCARIGMPLMRSITITLLAAPVPVDAGHEQQGRVAEIAAELRAVGRLAREVELVLQRLRELVDHLARTQAAGVGEHALEHETAAVCSSATSLQMTCPMSGAQHLHRHRRAVGQLGEMHLRHRGARHRRQVERPGRPRRPASGRPSRANITAAEPAEGGARNAGCGSRAMAREICS